MLFAALMISPVMGSSTTRWGVPWRRRITLTVLEAGGVVPLLVLDTDGDQYSFDLTAGLRRHPVRSRRLVMQTCFTFGVEAGDPRMRALSRDPDRLSDAFHRDSGSRTLWSSSEEIQHGNGEARDRFPGLTFRSTCGTTAGRTPIRKPRNQPRTLRQRCRRADVRRLS